MSFGVMNRIKTHKDLTFYINKDRERYNYSFFSYLKGLLYKQDTSHALRLLYYLRKSEFYYNNQSTIINKALFKLYYLFYCRLEFKYDTHIALNCCGFGLWIPHMGGIIINAKSLGNSCSITKGVVIGNKAGEDNRAVIGNNCYFTLGAKIIGSVVIGDNVIVGQNSVVIKDIASNSIVSGIPAKVIKTYDNILDIKI